jgi:hypothetical protein
MVFMPFQADFTAEPVAGRRPNAAVFRGVDWAVAVAYTYRQSFVWIGDDPANCHGVTGGGA